MNEPAPLDRLTRRVNRISVAVWVVVALLLLNLAISLLTLLSPTLLAKRVMEILPEHLGSSTELGVEDLNSFSDWPVEKQIASASVIVITKWEKSDSVLKCIISEIAKQAPNTAFYYKAGDEYRRGDQRIKGDTSYGDGQIMFFTGSPASFRFSTTIKDDRILGMGEMPLSELRELIRKSK